MNAVTNMVKTLAHISTSPAVILSHAWGIMKSRDINLSISGNDKVVVTKE